MIIHHYGKTISLNIINNYRFFELIICNLKTDKLSLYNHDVQPFWLRLSVGKQFALYGAESQALNITKRKEN
jgi:hypothetical protein